MVYQNVSIWFFESYHILWFSLVTKPIYIIKSTMVNPRCRVRPLRGSWCLSEAELHKGVHGWYVRSTPTGACVMVTVPGIRHFTPHEAATAPWCCNGQPALSSCWLHRRGCPLVSAIYFRWFGRAQPVMAWLGRYGLYGPNHTFGLGEMCHREWKKTQLWHLLCAIPFIDCLKITCQGGLSPAMWATNGTPVQVSTRWSSKKPSCACLRWRQLLWPHHWHSCHCRATLAPVAPRSQDIRKHSKLAFGKLEL